MRTSRPLRILLLKPYQPVSPLLCHPQLGLLYLASTLRARFGAEIDAEYWDNRLFHEPPEAFAARVAGQYDVVGISSVNFEADVSHRLARALHAHAPQTIVAMGGPYAHSAPDRARAEGVFDWIFDGEAERTFPAAIAARFFGVGALESVPGLSWRPDLSAPYVVNGGEDVPDDLDAIPWPAWDLVPFDLYSHRPNMNGQLRARRYAPLFTSRGCPYKCNYCHDIFGKSFRWRSAESVHEEIDYLVREHGVGEFQITDDIYNLHRPRMKRISELVTRDFGSSLRFNFPNGLRSDILKVEDLRLLKAMGAYEICVAIETATPRLQKLVEKNLDLERARSIIDAAADLGISVKGFFMMGFPTETLEEIESTIRFAVDSKLTQALFHVVLPQEGTPIHELAKKESPAALEQVLLQDYYTERPWYDHAYGINLREIHRRAYRRFYFHPRRWARLLRNISPGYIVFGVWRLFRVSVLKTLPFQGPLDRLMGWFGVRRAEAFRRAYAAQRRRAAARTAAASMPAPTPVSAA